MHSVPKWIDGPPFSAMPRVPSMRTLGGSLPGVLAEYVCFLKAGWSPHQKTLSDIEASTLPVAGLTAWFALVEKGGLRAGQYWCKAPAAWRYLVLQIAKAMGAQVIITSSSDEKLQKAWRWGWIWLLIVNESPGRGRVPVDAGQGRRSHTGAGWR